MLLKLTKTNWKCFAAWRTSGTVYSNLMQWTQLKLTFSQYFLNSWYCNDNPLISKAKPIMKLGHSFAIYTAGSGEMESWYYHCPGLLPPPCSGLSVLFLPKPTPFALSGCFCHELSSFRMQFIVSCLSLCFCGMPEVHKLMFRLLTALTSLPESFF